PAMDPVVVADRHRGGAEVGGHLLDGVPDGDSGHDAVMSFRAGRALARGFGMLGASCSTRRRGSPVHTVAPGRGPHGAGGRSSGGARARPPAGASNDAEL